MQENPEQPLTIYFCHAPQDKSLKEFLDKHLCALNLKHPNQITTQSNHDIKAGEERVRRMLDDFEKAHIILLLISADFISNPDCCELMERTIERHNRTDVYGFSILIRPTDWKATPFSKLHMLPSNHKAITSWPDRNKACTEIVGIVEKEVNNIRAEQWLKRGGTLHTSKRYNEAIDAFRQSFNSNPNSIFAYYKMGEVLRDRYIFTPGIGPSSMAVACFKKVIEIEPTYGSAYYHLGKELYRLQEYEEALAAFEQAIRYTPHRIGVIAPLYEKGNVLRNLRKSTEALAIFDSIIQLEPTFTEAYESKFEILCSLNRFEESNALYQEALTIFERLPEGITYGFTSYGKGWSLFRLGRNEEALIAFDEAIAKYPGLPQAYYGKGTILHLLSKHREALITLDKAIERDAYFDRAYYRKGLVLYDLEQYEEALVVFKQAIRISPNCPYYFYEMSRTLVKMGESYQAREAYIEAQQLGYST